MDVGNICISYSCKSNESDLVVTNSNTQRELAQLN